MSLFLQLVRFQRVMPPVPGEHSYRVYPRFNSNRNTETKVFVPFFCKRHVADHCSVFQRACGINAFQAARESM